MATIKDSQKQERKHAIKYGGQVNPGSGNQWLRKGDVRTDDTLWELKITDKQSYSLKDADLKKHANHALLDGLIPIFLVEFKTSGNRWVILDENDYSALKESSNIGNETP